MNAAGSSRAVRPCLTYAYTYKRANIMLTQTFLSEFDYQELLFAIQNIDEAVQWSCTALCGIFDKCVPKLLIRNRVFPRALYIDKVINGFDTTTNGFSDYFSYTQNRNGIDCGVLDNVDVFGGSFFDIKEISHKNILKPIRVLKGRGSCCFDDVLALK